MESRRVGARSGEAISVERMRNQEFGKTLDRTKGEEGGLLRRARAEF